jgi:cytoskeletal protein RodZ
MIWRRDTPTEPVEERQRGFDDFELKLGDVLRGERATLGKSLLDVQRELHIRAAYIAAIENGDLDVFEAPSFVAGFVRSYARYLGMDPEWVYERFCIEHDFQVTHGMMSMGGTTQRAQRSAPVTASRVAPQPGALRGVGTLPDPDPFWKRIEPGALGSVSVLLVLILGLGYAGWTVLNEVQRVQVAPADMVPNVVSDFDPLSPGDNGTETALDSDPLDGAADGTGSLSVRTAEADAPSLAEGRVRVARPQALDMPVVVPRDGPIAAIVPETREAVRPVNARSGTDDAVALALSDPSEAPQVVDDGPATVELLAVRPSWLRVRAADGTVIFERILDAGERYTIPQTEESPTLHAGNSGSVYFLINGQAYGPAAEGANVVRNVPLDVGQLQQTYALADPDSDRDLAVHVARLRDE